MSSSSRETDIFKLVKEKLENTIDSYMDTRRSRRGKYSIDSSITLIKLVLTINSLPGSDETRRQAVEELVKSMYPVEKTVARNKGEIVYESRMDILRHLHGKKKTTVSSIFSKKTSVDEILDYIWLRKEGVIKKSRSGKLLIDPRIYSEEFDEERTRKISIRDLVKYLREIPSQLWLRVLSEPLLNSLSNNEFMKILSTLYGFNSKVDRRIMRELEHRLKQGWKPSSIEWREISDLLTRSRTRLDKYMGPYTIHLIEPSLIDRGVREKIVEDVRNLPLRERWRVLSKLSSRREYGEVLRELDPLTLSSINNPNRYDARLKNKIMLGKSLANYINYLITLDESYLDYSKYFLSRIDQSMLEPSMRPLYKSLLEGDRKNIVKYLNRMYSVEAIEYISAKLWDQMRSTSGLDKDMLWRAVELGYRILKYSIHGVEYVGEPKTSYTRGRVSVKKTVYNFTRYNYVVARKWRERRSRVNALVDVSGSMLRYSTWAVLSLSSIISLVKNIVLFSDKVHVFKPPRRTSRYLVVNYLEKLFTEGFQGYTNISLALRTASSIAGLNDTTILFTDLEQTVHDTEPWIEASKYLLHSGRRLLVFTPPSHRGDVAEEFRRIGCDVIVVKDPVKIPKLLKRKLNIRVSFKRF